MLNNQVVANFKETKEHDRAVMLQLEHLIQQGEELGIDMTQGIQQKLQRVLEEADHYKHLKVVLVGGFSEGKTSIAAGWLGRYDVESMNISARESSDEVQSYIVDDDVELIDTPGLFGLHEKFDGQSGTIEKYKDITKKYVSEAHLVLYVMNPTNPIKESHRADLMWLFRTLDLLPRTVFVLSRFDEVADIEDAVEYQEELEIKRENVTERLDQMLQLTPHEKKQLQIVAVSANPEGRGMDYWMSHAEEYREISHMDTLQAATQRVMERNGGSESILYKMQDSVIADILGVLQQTENGMDKLNDVIEECNETSSVYGKKLESLKEKIGEARSRLLNFVKEYFAGLIRRLDGCSLETIQTFIEAEVGKKGEIVQAKIDNEFCRETSSINGQIGQMAMEFQADMNQAESMFETVGKDGLKIAQNSKFINAANIKAARDGLVKISGMLGKDVSKFLKFKPWGAVKFAERFSGGLAALQIALELWDYKRRKEAEQKLQQSIHDGKESFMEARTSILEKLKSEDFATEFFPQYGELKEIYEGMQTELKNYRERKQKMDEWSEEVRKLASEARS